MRKFYTLGLALLSVFAFGAIAASAAFAEHEWLFNGGPVTSELTVLSETEEVGGLLLEDMKGGLFGEGIDVLCSGLDEGTVGPGGKDLVTKIFDLEGRESPPNEIICESMSASCGAPVEVLPVNLPWSTELFLNGLGEFRDLVGPGNGGEPGWSVTCHTSIGPVTDTCTGHTNVAVSNTTEGDVLITFDSGKPEETATCTRGGEKQGLVEGAILIFHDEGSLSVS